ncbi:MAG: SRPBCC domain-containing protein [Bdellovibrionales bacterium]|nr:SRPBCC domain-containing protein [Bdellovibrionales bacterium]
MRHAGSLELKSEKQIKKPVKEVFQALSEGLLFMNCGADSESIELDFRVGGKYKVQFKSYGLTNLGEFLEIVPEKKIVFTWCTSFEHQIPDSTVTIELLAEGNQTRLLLKHVGFADEESRAAHQGGWDGGIADMAKQMQEGTLRMVRVYSSPIEKLFATCQEKLVIGKALELVPNKKIVFDAETTRVTLTFDQEDDGGSSFELVQSNLPSPGLQKSFRKNWERISESMALTLGRG